MKTKHYHNTNRLDQITARLEAKKNLRQEDIIYCIFKTTTLKSLSASEVWKWYTGKIGNEKTREYMKIAYGGSNTPLTSIRRGMSNLQREGILEKTNKTTQGIYGKQEHFYRLSQTKIYE